MVSEAQKRATKKYNDKVYDALHIRVPKGYANVIREEAKKRGESVNNFILTAIKDRIENERCD